MADPTTAAEAAGNGAAPEYGPSYFANYWGGVPYERNERWLAFFGEVADGVVRDLHPVSALDAGCAMGFLVEALRARGVDAAGIDVSDYAISRVDESAAQHCRVASVTEPLERRYDLITCIEVLEHLPAAEADAALANLCSATDRLLLSSTPGDFGEPTHVNVRPPEDWSAKLAQLGFLREVELDLSYISPWATLYVRREEPLADSVRRYDRSWWRLRRETAEVRESLLASQRRIAELESLEKEVSRDELERERDRQAEELLELRDLLIGKDAELGHAKGRLAEFENRSLRVASIRHRLQSRIPGLGRLLGALEKLLHGRQG